MRSYSVPGTGTNDNHRSNTAALFRSPGERHRNGYAALLAVIVIGAAAVALSHELATSAIDRAAVASLAISSLRARRAADNCAQDALARLEHGSIVADTAASITFTDSACSYTVTVAGDTAVITISGTSAAALYRLNLDVRMDPDGITVTGWDENQV